MTDHAERRRPRDARGRVRGRRGRGDRAAGRSTRSATARASPRRWPMPCSSTWRPRGARASRSSSSTPSTTSPRRSPRVEASCASATSSSCAVLTPRSCRSTTSGRPTPTRAATPARSRRSTRRSPPRRRGCRATPGRERLADRADTPIVRADNRGLVKVNPLANWSDADVDAYIARARRADQPAAGARLPVDRLLAVHSRVGGGEKTPGRPLGRLAKTECGLQHDDFDRSVTHDLQRADHLDALESQAIFIIREVAASCAAPSCCSPAARTPWCCSTWSRRRLRPAPFPFPVCTSTPATTSPRCSTSATVVVSRARRAPRGGLGTGIDRLRARGRPWAPALLATACRRSRCSTRSPTHGFDACFGGARRDEDKARAKERIFSFRDAFGQWDPRNQRPELWHLYNGRVRPGEHVRAFPISDWTELDVWRYIAARAASSCRRSTSPTSERWSERDGMLPRRERVGAAASERDGRGAHGALSHGRRHELHRRGRLRGA